MHGTRTTCSVNRGVCKIEVWIIEVGLYKFSIHSKGRPSTTFVYNTTQDSNNTRCTIKTKLDKPQNTSIAAKVACVVCVRN